MIEIKSARVRVSLFRFLVRRPYDNLTGLDVDDRVPVKHAYISCIITKLLKQACCAAKQKVDGSAFRHFAIFRVALRAKLKNAALRPAVFVLDLRKKYIRYF